MLGPIGKVLGPRGLKGELKLKLFRASPSYLAAGRICVGDRLFELVRVAWIDGVTPVVRLGGVDDRDAAEALAGAPLSVDPAWFRGPEGPIELLIGAEVFDADTGAPLGLAVTGIDTNGAQDLLVLGEHLVPFVDALVRVELGEDGRRRVRLRAIEGLLS